MNYRPCALRAAHDLIIVQITNYILVSVQKTTLFAECKLLLPPGVRTFFCPDEMLQIDHLVLQPRSALEPKYVLTRASNACRSSAEGLAQNSLTEPSQITTSRCDEVLFTLKKLSEQQFSMTLLHTRQMVQWQYLSRLYFLHHDLRSDICDNNTEPAPIMTPCPTLG